MTTIGRDVPEPGWAHRWMIHLRSIDLVDETVERAGQAYVGRDDEFEVTVAPGHVVAVAGEGWRLSHIARLDIPTLGAAQWDEILAAWARQPMVATAILAGRFAPSLVDVGEPGALLLPAADEMAWSCDCRRFGTATDSRPCRHVAALLTTLGDHLEVEPHDLLVLRGGSRGQLETALDQSGTAAGDMVDPAMVWAAEPAPLPPPLEAPPSPGRLAPFASPPPPSAPFTAEGLKAVVDLAATRSWRALTEHRPLGLVGFPEFDLVRMAAEADDSTRRRLAAAAGLTGQELSARVQAWNVAGPSGVEAHRDPVERRRMGDIELRRGPDGAWFRFGKQRGRWLLVAAAEEPAED